MPKDASTQGDSDVAAVVCADGPYQARGHTNRGDWQDGLHFAERCKDFPSQENATLAQNGDSPDPVNRMHRSTPANLGNFALTSSVLSRVSATAYQAIVPAMCPGPSRSKVRWDHP